MNTWYDSNSTLVDWSGYRFRPYRPYRFEWERKWTWVRCPHCDMDVGIEPRLWDELQAEGGTVHCGRGHAFAMEPADA